MRENALTSLPSKFPAQRAPGGPGRPRQAYESGTLRYSFAGVIVLVCWLLVGELGIAVHGRWAHPTGLVVLRNYAASDTTVSLLISTLPAVLSIFVLPYIGYRSDHFRSRWGRRRPVKMVSAPLGALAMAGIAFAPQLAAQVSGALGVWSPELRTMNIGLFCLFWTVFDCAALTTATLFAGFVSDVMPRPFLGRFYAVFRIAGLGIAISFNQWVFALTDDHLFDILIAIALIFGLAIPLMCIMTREGLGPAVHEQVPPAERGRLKLALSQLAACYTQPRYLWMFALFMLAAVTFSPFNTFSQNYALGLGISKATLGSLTATAYTVSIVSAFAIGWLVDRYGALRVSASMMSAYCIVALAGYLCIDGAEAFQYVYLAHIIVSGAYFTAAASLPMSLFPTSDFVRYNSTKETMVAFANIIISTTQGAVLDRSGHDYRLTLASATGFSMLTLVCMVKLRKTAR
jgi:MFS family permease